MKDFIDRIAGVEEGTDINRANLMAIQGFITNTIIVQNHSIIETNSDEHTLTTTFNSGGSITQVFVGEKKITITKTITFNGNQISEVIS